MTLNQFILLSSKPTENDSPSIPLAAFMSLLHYTKYSTNDIKTIQEYSSNIHIQSTILKSHSSSISTIAGCDLFIKLLTNLQQSAQCSTFEDLKAIIISDGQQKIQKCIKYRDLTAEYALDFILDGMTVLVHSYSRVVMLLLKKAAIERHLRFKVIVTEAVEPNNGQKIIKALRNDSISCTLIPDSAVGFIMDTVDMVLVGGEGVCQNGGLINQVGTFQIAVMAQYCNKPVYALVESYKFVSNFPLSQRDLPGDFKLEWKDQNQENQEISTNSPSVDYTPPSLISLIITDYGILTPLEIAENLVMGDEMEEKF